MSISLTTGQTSGMRPLADAECDDGNGGSAALVVIGAGLIAFGVTYTLTHGTMGDAVRNVLEERGLR
jgi:hypothetical protein